MGKGKTTQPRRRFLQAVAATGLAATSTPAAAASTSKSVGGPASYRNGRLPLRVRRVVTGHDSEGQSVTVIDEIVSTVTSAREGHQDALIWTSGTTPADNGDAADGALRKGPNSTVFRVARYNPGVAPLIHYQQSVDYAVVLAGLIEMQLDRGSVTLTQGDVLVQRGTMHNWVNHGPDPCVVVFVLIEAQAAGNSDERRQQP